MSDVAAGSNAALQLQQNMAAAPDVQQQQAMAVQQQQENLQKTKLANLVSDSSIKVDAELKNKMQALIKDKGYTESSPSDQVLKIASLYGEAGKTEDMAKLIKSSVDIEAKELSNKQKTIDLNREQISSAATVLENLADDKVNDGFSRLPKESQQTIINKVGKENWDNFSPKEKKAVVHNLFESVNNKLQEQKIAANIEIAKIRAKAQLEAAIERNNHTERMRGITQDLNVKMWGSVNSAIDRVQRDPATIKERERLDEEVDKAQTAATKSTTFGSYTTYKPEGSDQQFYSKDAFEKYMQAVRKRDKHIAAQLDEEEALVNTLPKDAGTLKQSQLDKIAKQRATLQLDEPAKKKTEAAPAKPEEPKKDTSNKYTQDNPAKPTSKEEYDKLPPNSYYMQDGVLKRKKG
jgi:hypothetical protein